MQKFSQTAEFPTLRLLIAVKLVCLPSHRYIGMLFLCTALAFLRQRHAHLFTPGTNTMRSFFAQQDHLGVLNYVIDCLDFMKI